jgi:murein DD-endopeptidase MepM/ murein hydrolase activator NlpD
MHFVVEMWSGGSTSISSLSNDIPSFYFSVPTGTPIFAPADGVVKRAYYIGGFGNHIKLDHSSGYSTTFAHLSKIFVRHGQKIKRGDIIGETGNTGRSTAPHLHYEVHYRGTPKNPADFFFTQVGN